MSGSIPSIEYSGATCIWISSLICPSSDQMEKVTELAASTLKQRSPHTSSLSSDAYLWVLTRTDASRTQYKSVFGSEIADCLESLSVSVHNDCFKVCI